MGDRLAAAQHIGRRLLERAGALGGRDDDGATAVGDEAAIAHGEGMAHHARGQHALDGQRLLLPRGRIEQRPLARGYRHGRQLLARGAELVHVARGGERVGARRHERLERQLVRVDLAHRGLLAADAALRAAVGDHGDVAEAERDGAHGMGDVVLERRAADDGGAEEWRVDAEILGQRQHRQTALGGGGEQAVDILQTEPAIVERPLGALRHQVDDGKAVCHLAEIGFRNPDDGCAAPFEPSHHAPSAGTKTG